MKIAGYFLLLIPFLLISCGSKSMNDIHSVSDVFHKSQFQTLYPGFKQEELTNSMQKFFSDTNLISKYYKANQHATVWVKDTFEVAKIDTLLYYLKNSTEHGLNPDFFETKAIQAIRDSVMNGSYSSSISSLYAALVQLENKATRSTHNYVSGMNYGFIDQKKTFAKDYTIPLQQPDSVFNEFVFANIGSRLVYLLSEVQPKDSVYAQIQKELKYYRAFPDSAFEIIPVKKETKNYKLNDSDPKIMSLIAKRLMVTGELPKAQNPDSIYKTLTPELMAAINIFRNNNSYPEDEEVGKVTIDALNRPMSYYENKAVANLERYRWKRQTALPKKYVLANVAAFRLMAVEPGQKTLTMNVCVGKAFTNQTPLLESEIYYINLNPTWGVPRSIIEKEMYYSVKRDPNYFKRNRMQITHNGKSVNADTVNWSRYTDPKRFPFAVRQDAGDGNSLGRIKFMFDNPFSVYLHDTPSKRALTYKNRAVSHGCVRIQKPMDFAFFCLAEKDSVYYDRIRYSVDQPVLSQKGKELQKQGKLTKLPNILNLEERIPLFIDYFTMYAIPGEDKLYYADDVYGFDDKINKELKKILFLYK